MKRLIEIDLARTVAILLMIVYHAVWDLSTFYAWNIDPLQGGWLLFQRLIASLFLGLVGVSAAISYGKSSSWKKHCKRCARVGMAGLLISVATYVMDPETYVRFGILHLIAVSAILLPLCRRLAIWSILPGLIVLALGPVAHRTIADVTFLLPLGIRYGGFRSVDYYPLLPWFGIILIGYGIGYAIYGKGLRTMAYGLFQTHNSKPMALLAWPGKHALLLYLIHQPIIMAILWCTLGKPEG